ncbi:MAG TPA: OpgC domain-containing protein [Roseiarcus sp.]|nr:OpgC domain-containing protein [Roseiarcus sp.]
MLIAILVDHIPGNELEFFTPRNFGLSDSAEAFVFLSGLSVGLVYLPRARKHGLAAVARGCFQRALKLYSVHIALTGAALAIFALAFWLSGVEDLIEAHGRSFVFGSPMAGLTGLAMLSHQLGYFNILPLYVVLMLWAPLALALAMRNATLALVSSAATYAASRVFGLHLPSWPEPGAWFFNPFAWQLAFTIGLVCAIVWRNGPPRATPVLVAASIATLALAAFAATSGVGLAPGLRDAASAHLDLAKQDLGLARLAHFVALAYLVAIAPGLARLVDGRPGRAVQNLGRNSLAIFAAGSLVAAIGQAALGAASPYTSEGVVHLAGLAYTLAGIAALFAIAHWIEYKKTSAPPGGADFRSAAPQPL